MCSILRNRIIWFDLETGGLNAAIHPIIEIAALDNHGNSFHSLIKSEQPLQPIITQITNITDELLEKEGRNHKDVMYDFHKYLCGDYLPSALKTNHRTFVIAHNGDRFDKIFLNNAFQKYNIIMPNNICFVDSLKLSRIVMPELKNHKQQTLAETFNINSINAHRAQGDVAVLSQIWVNLVEKYHCMYEKNDIIAIYNQLYNHKNHV
jgi:DNA polymerase III alpha subunit (gram-positive type)